MLQEILLDVILLAGMVILGAQIARAILGSPGRLAILSLAFPLGGGALTWFVFLLSWAGIHISLLTVSIAYLILFVIATIVHLRSGAREAAGEVLKSSAVAAQSKRSPLRGWLWGILLVLFLLAALFAVGRAYSRWDANAGWAVKGYGIALTGSVYAGQTWGAWGLSYPLNTPMQIAFFEMISGDDLPGSKLLFPFFYVSLLLACYRFWRRSEVGSGVAGLGVLLLATNPLIFLHATIGYANLPLACYLVMAVMWGIDGIYEQRLRALVASGLLFGLAAWTRAEAVTYFLAAIPLLLLALRITKVGKVYIAPWLLPWIVMAALWFAFGWTSVQGSHLGKAMNGVFPNILAGEFRLRELYYIPRTLSQRAVDLEIWGLLFPVAGILGILGWRRLWPVRAPKVFMALTAAVALTVVPIGLFYVRSFTRWVDFIPLLNRSFDRAFLPASFMIVVLAVLMHATDSPTREQQSFKQDNLEPSQV